MSISPITLSLSTYSTPPQTSDPVNFDSRADLLFGTELPRGVGEWNAVVAAINAMITAMNIDTGAVTVNTAAAAVSAAAAAVNAAAAAASAGATVWVTGTTYSAGAVKYSPTNYQTYRDTTGGVSNTDPASDTTGRWISAMLPSAEAIGLPAMPPTAVFNFASGVIDRRFVEQRTTKGTRYTIFGNLEAVQVGVALPNYIPATNVCEGYLAEAAGENVIPYSEDLSTSLFAGATSSNNVTTAPDGQTTADKLVESAGVAQHLSYENVLSANGKFTFSVYVKAVERSVLCVAMSDRASGNAGCRVDLSTGTVEADGAYVGSWTAITYGIEPCANGWYRVWIKATRGAGTGTEVYVVLTDGVTTYGTYNGDGVSGAYVWGRDLKAGDLSSYIPTSGAPATRAIGGLVMDLTAHTDVINPLGFSFVAAFDGDRLLASLTASPRLLVSFGSTSTSYISLTLIDQILYFESATSAVPNFTALNIGTIAPGRNVVAVSLGNDTARGILRGGTAQSSSPVTIIATPTLQAGGNYPAFSAETAIELIATYPRACTAGELTALVNNI